MNDVWTGQTETETNRQVYEAERHIGDWRQGPLKKPVVVPPEGVTVKEFVDSWPVYLKHQYNSHIEAWKAKQKRNNKRKAQKASRRKNRS